MVDHVSLVRTVEFSAGHHYRRPDWSEEENARVFGESRHPHGHNWSLTVSVRGPVDPETGFVVDLAALDALLDRVVEPLDQRDLNRVIPEVRDGSIQPSTESLARWFWSRLAPEIPGDARLERVRVAELPGLAAEYRGPGVE